MPVAGSARVAERGKAAGALPKRGGQQLAPLSDHQTEPQKGPPPARYLWLMPAPRLTTIDRFDPSRDFDQVAALWRQVFAYDSPHNAPALIIEKSSNNAMGCFSLRDSVNRWSVR